MSQQTLDGEPATRLVNVNDHGRDGVTMIDRSTQFGNPFRMQEDGGVFTREGCIDAYREWFGERIETDPDFQLAVEQLRGETLGCHCKPKRCHGDVILEYLHGGSEQRDEP